MYAKTQAIKPWLWKRFIDIFFIWTDSEENLNKFLKDLHEFHPNLKFTYEKFKEKINFLDLVILLMVKLLLIFIASLQIVTSIYIMIRATQNTLKYQ